MSEAKQQVLTWKKWKASRHLLNQTKQELMSDVKAIAYTDEMPGGNHKSIAQKYNKLLEDVKVYDDYIKAYDVMIKRLESAVASLLTESEREVVLIYANYPNKGDSDKRENEALKQGYSRAYFYELINASFDTLDEVLDKAKLDKMLFVD